MGSNPGLPESFLHLVSPTNTCCLTQRAVDLWVGTVRLFKHFSGFGFFFCSQTESTPAHRRYPGKLRRGLRIPLGGLSLFGLAGGHANDTTGN